MSLLTYAAHQAWIGSNRGAHSAFVASLDRLAEEQESFLLGLVRRNAETAYGRACGFGSTASVRDYQRLAPITDYEDYAPHIERISAGEKAVLTSEDVLLFEPTSGSSSAIKYIPYTRGLKRDFLRGIAPWIVSLYRRRPALMRGKSYWSISPGGSTPNRLGCIPVGFEDDGEYLGGLGRWLLNQTMAVPPDVARTADTETFRHDVLVHLIRERDLAFISVWSPTFLTLLLRHFVEHAGAILQGVRGSDPRRAEEIAAIMRDAPGTRLFESIWPKLSVVSCWADGACERDVPRLREFFPTVEIQGKGLLATEAIVSIPLVPGHDPVLAARSHFFEFEDLASGQVRLAHELEEGRQYSVIVSTSGGLYRYRLHDTIRVTGHVGQTPAMRFVGKDNCVSDQRGEKLNASHAAACLDRLFARHGVEPAFALLAPDECAGDALAYTLFLQCHIEDEPTATALASELDAMLRENYHYDYCRRLGQLEQVGVFLIDSAASPHQAYTDEMMRRGMKMGDIKPTVLDRQTGWREAFQGRYVDSVVLAET